MAQLVTKVKKIRYFFESGNHCTWAKDLISKNLPSVMVSSSETTGGFFLFVNPKLTSNERKMIDSWVSAYGGVATES